MSGTTSSLGDSILPVKKRLSRARTDGRRQSVIRRQSLEAPEEVQEKKLRRMTIGSVNHWHSSSYNANVIELSNKKRFKPSGDFEKDFTELCTLVGIPSLCVVTRPKRPLTPSTSSPPDTSMSKSSKEDKKNSANQNHQDISKSTDLELQPPRTYVVSDNIYEYLKPRVEVETDDEGNKSFVKEMYIRGWQVDARIIEVLSVTMAELERLTIIDFWNAGLNDETLLSLGHCLASSTSLKTLRLDGNEHTTEQRFDIFLSEKSTIQNLSLKSCALSDKGALRLGDALLENKNLLTLNLCFNKITDVGAEHLGNGLRINRNLLSLNLGSNTISDQGAKKLAETLSTFPLTHEQVVARRMLKSNLNGDDMLSPTHSSSQDRPPTASRSFSKEEKKKGSKKKETNNKLTKENSVKRGPSNADTKSGKGQKSKTTALSKQDRNKTPVQENEASYEFKNPLLEKTREINGELWIPGNRCLINLNLARNKISELGLNSLYTAMKYQVDQANEGNRTVAIGLMRLSLQRNDFSGDHPTHILLCELMKTRDPNYKPPTPPPIAEDSKLVHNTSSNTSSDMKMEEIKVKLGYMLFNLKDRMKVAYMHDGKYSVTVVD